MSHMHETRSWNFTVLPRNYPFRGPNRPAVKPPPSSATKQKGASQLLHRLADTTLPPGTSCRQWPLPLI